MKEIKLTLIRLIGIVFLTFLSYQSIGQYLSVIEHGKSWNYFSLNFHDQMDSCVINGDTIIDQKKYYEIYSYYGWGMGPELIGYMREDTINGQLYRTPSLNQIGEEELVYDISMDIGDTITIEFIDYIVDSIDFNNGQKHIYFLNPYWYEYGPVIFIEGIGSIANMFGIQSFDYYHSVLLCTHLDSLNIYTRDFMEWFPYLDSNLCWADVIISIDEGVNQNNKITIYPNPFTTSTTIEYELTEPSQVQLTIYNAIGETIHVATEGIKPQGKHTYEWSAESLSEGMYYAVLKSEDGVSVTKLLKQ